MKQHRRTKSPRFACVGGVGCIQSCIALGTTETPIDEQPANCGDNHGGGGVRAAANRDERGHRKVRRYDRRMDSHAHGNPRAALRRARRRRIASGNGGGEEAACGERREPGRDRHDRAGHRYAGHAVPGDGLPDSGSHRREESVGIRSLGGVLGVSVRTHRRRAIRCGRARTKKCS